jgi:hypothetical protein
MNEFFKKEWKNLVWLIGIIISGIVLLQTAVSDVKILKPKVEKLELFSAVQNEINQSIKEKLRHMDEKLDRLLRR